MTTKTEKEKRMKMHMKGTTWGGLAAWVLATVWGVGWCQGQSLTVDLAGVPIQLEANLAGQKVVIMGLNSTGVRWR
jgi:hypothetical protein